MSAATDQAGLIRAVCENPDDDLPRLVYADWCEENGEGERAEFIRAQLALDAHDRGLDSAAPGTPPWPGYLTFSRRKTLNTRMHQLLARHGREWLETKGLATYSGRAGFPVEGWLFKEAGGPGVEIGMKVKRGFVEEVRGPLADLEKHLPALVPAHPITAARATDTVPCVETNGRAHWHRADQGLGPDVKFPTAEAAHAALSLTLVNKARAAAGLPPLPRP